MDQKEFSKVNYSQWLANIEKDLGENKARLWFQHESGLNYDPLYTAENSVKTEGPLWHSASKIVVESSEALSEEALRSWFDVGVSVVICKLSSNQVELCEQSGQGAIRRERRKLISLSEFHNVGAHQVHELGIAIELLNQTNEPAMLEVSVGSEIYIEIAKLRALRQLIKDKDVLILLRTSVRQMSINDPWVNLLRGTAGSFVAIIGGADLLITEPFNLLCGPTDDFGKRLAINTALILKEESHLRFDQDPTQGSFAFETMTANLLTEAKKFHAEFMQTGEALEKSEWLKSQIQTSVERKKRSYRRRKEPITGVSEFPVFKEKWPGNTVKSFTEFKSKNGVLGLPVVRWAEEFEKLRRASQMHLATTGKSPQIFILAVGPIANFVQRLTWVQNFFEVGGFEVILDGGEHNLDSALVVWKKSKVELGVLCSSDNEYEAILNSKGTLSKNLTVAGNPGDNTEKWKQKGVLEFVHVGIDVVEKLQKLLLSQGVKL